MNSKQKNNIFLIIAISFGILIGVFLAPKDKFFLGNFAYYWGPHAALFLLIIILRFRIAILTGAAFVLAVYLLAFHSWVFSLPRPESLLWILYLSSFFGAGIGILVAGFYCKRDPDLNNFQTTGVGAVATLIGLVLSLFIMNQIFT